MHLYFESLTNWILLIRTNTLSQVLCTIKGKRSYHTGVPLFPFFFWVGVLLLQKGQYFSSFRVCANEGTTADESIISSSFRCDILVHYVTGTRDFKIKHVLSHVKPPMKLYEDACTIIATPPPNYLQNGIKTKRAAKKKQKNHTQKKINKKTHFFSLSRPPSLLSFCTTMSNSKDVSVQALTCALVLIFLVGFGSCNIDQDRAECTDQLVGLAPCLPYVGGDAKTPTLDC